MGSDRGPAAPAGRLARAWHAASPTLGLLLVAIGGAKLHGDPNMVSRFAEWGYAPWFLVAAGFVEVGLGLAVFYGPTRGMGAAGLATWMAGACWTHLRAGEAAVALLPATILVIFAAGATYELRSHGWHPRPPAPLRDPPARPMAGLLFAVQLVGVSFLMRWAIGGIAFSMALPLLALGHARADGALRDHAHVVRLLLLYLLVLGMGVGGLWGFVGHFLMSDAVAASVGWRTGSPFQKELAFYHLGLGVLGVLALWIRDRLWLAVGLLSCIFLYGAGWVHLTDFLVRGNTAERNWGVGVLFGNVIVPTAVLVLLALHERHDRPADGAAAQRRSMRSRSP